LVVLLSGHSCLCAAPVEKALGRQAKSYCHKRRRARPTRRDTLKKGLLGKSVLARPWDVAMAGCYPRKKRPACRCRSRFLKVWF